jgi:hypothetical protein
VTNTAYYDRFKTRVDVAEHIGVSFDNPVLWDLKSQELYSMDFDSLADATKESKVKDNVKPSSSIVMIKSTASLRRPWQTTMRRWTSTPTQTVVVQH